MRDCGAPARRYPVNAFEYQQFFDFAREHWWFVGTRRIICDAIATAVPDAPHPRILDVGCGAGNVLEALGGTMRLFGLDAELGALEVCRTHVAAPLCLGDATALPYADETFDVVIATDLFEHVADDARAARECARVCRPGGTLVAAVPAYPLLFGPHDIQLDHHRRYARAPFLALLQHAGLTVRRATYFNSLLLPVIVAVRLAQRIFVRRPHEYAINYALGSGAVGRVLLGLLMLERWWLRRGNLPAGVSLLTVATRPPS